MFKPAAREVHAAKPTAAFIARLERQISMPAGAWPITRYVRYYAMSVEDGHEIVRGLFVAPAYAGQKAGVHIVTKASLPEAEDFGCKAGVLTYDLSDHRLTRLACNGM